MLKILKDRNGRQQERYPVWRKMVKFLNCTLLLWSCFFSRWLNASAFVVPKAPLLYSSASTVVLSAKKKKSRNNNSGKGFGGSSTKKNDSSSDAGVPILEDTVAASTTSGIEGGFSSVNTGSASPREVTLDLKEGLSAEERNKEILKQKFGLRTFEEQQGDFKAAERIAKNKSRMQKIKEMKDEEFDIFAVVPPGVLKGIDLFLKTGLTITTTAFVLAGFAITAEAWSVATNNELPPDVDQFIVNIVEPNFTTGLFVLLGFSISLGIFASVQLGSSASIYSED